MNIERWATQNNLTSTQVFQLLENLELDKALHLEEIKNTAINEVMNINDPRPNMKLVKERVKNKLVAFFNSLVIGGQHEH